MSDHDLLMFLLLGTWDGWCGCVEPEGGCTCELSHVRGTVHLLLADAFATPARVNVSDLSPCTGFISVHKEVSLYVQGCFCKLLAELHKMTRAPGPQPMTTLVNVAQMTKDMPCTRKPAQLSYPHGALLHDTLEQRLTRTGGLHNHHPGGLSEICEDSPIICPRQYSTP
jgi:hypothetical protein